MKIDEGISSFLSFYFLKGSGRTAAHLNLHATKRRSSRLIRQKIQDQGAFISRVNNREAISGNDAIDNAVTSSRRTHTIGDSVMMMNVNLKASHERELRDMRNMHHHSGSYCVLQEYHLVLSHTSRM